MSESRPTVPHSPSPAMCWGEGGPRGEVRSRAGSFSLPHGVESGAQVSACPAQAWPGLAISGDGAAGGGSRAVHAPSRAGAGGGRGPPLAHFPCLRLG